MDRIFKGNSLVKSIQNFVVVDIETTGLSPAKNDIIEIGAVKYELNRPVSTFQSLVQPTRRISKSDKFVSSEITKITGITDDMLRTAPGTSEVLKNFRRFLGGQIIVGHNVNFDINFLYDNLSEKLGKFLTNDYVDALRLSRMFLKNLEHHSLQDTCDYFHIRNLRAHRALQDCLATGQCYLKFQKYLESLM